MPLSRKAKTRIMKLAEFMESLPRSANKHFNMLYLLGHNGKDGPGEDHEIKPEALTVSDLHSCGTTACALGWACAMPYFKRLGLTWSVQNGMTGVEDSSIFDLDGIPGDAWGDLFGSHNKDKTPKAWAKRTRKLIEQWESV